MSEPNVPDDPFADGCYACGGARWEVTCIDDMCNCGEQCIHGDPPSPCRTCNGDGDREGLLYSMWR